MKVMSSFMMLTSTHTSHLYSRILEHLGAVEHLQLLSSKRWASVDNNYFRFIETVKWEIVQLEILILAYLWSIHAAQE